MQHEVRLTAGSTTLSRGGTVLLAAGLRGRFRRLEIAPGRLAAEMPPITAPASIAVTLEPPATVVRVDGAELDSSLLQRPEPGTVSVQLEPWDHPRHVEFLA
jgi:hypothetical protein